MASVDAATCRKRYKRVISSTRCGAQMLVNVGVVTTRYVDIEHRLLWNAGFANLRSVQYGCSGSN